MKSIILKICNFKADLRAGNSKNNQGHERPLTETQIEERQKNQKESVSKLVFLYSKLYFHNFRGKL